MHNVVKMNALWLIIAALVECSETKLQKHNVMNEIQHLTNAVVSRYFSESRCIWVVTETPGVYLLETEVPVFYITKVGTSNTLDNLLLTAINSGCLAFVLQVDDIKWMVEKFTQLFRSPASVHRANRRYIYLPTVATDEVSLKGVMNEVFSSKSMKWMPDLLIVNLLNDQEALGNMGFLKQMEDNRGDTDAYGNENLLGMSKQLDFVLEIYTHEFVGENPSERVILDIWVPGQGFVYGADIFPDKLENLMGKRLDTMSMSYIPFTVMILDIDPPVFDGIEFQALFEFGNKHNITWEKHYNYENWWGDIWNNGSGIGVFGSLAEDRVDFAFSGIYMVDRIYLYLDYSVTYYKSGLTGAVSKPKLLPAWLIPVLPFTSALWWGVLISIVVIIIALYIVSKSSDVLLGGDISGRYSTPWECIFRTTGMVLLQAPGDEAVDNGSLHNPMRHLVAWFVLYFLIVASAYAGGLAAILTFPHFQPPIETIKDLADSGLFWYGTDVAYLFSIQNTLDPTLKKVVGNFVARSEEEILEIAYEEDTALLVERLQGGYFTQLKYLTEDIMQNKRLMKEFILDDFIVICICKGSPYKEKLDDMIFKLHHSGILLHWEGETARKYLSHRLFLSIMESREPPSSHDVRLSLRHIQVTELAELSDIMQAQKTEE